MQSNHLRSGFTLIELLLVIGIVAILLSIVLVAINPTKQLGDARNVTRHEDVYAILNAVYQFAVENNGDLPGNIPTTSPKFICKPEVIPENCVKAGGVNLRMLSGSYLNPIPQDPQSPLTGTGTRYTIVQDTDGKITVAAPDAEQGKEVSVTR
jgi:type IV pilus assembly protein PilA